MTTPAPDPRTADAAGRQAGRQAMADRFGADISRTLADAPDPDPDLARDVQRLLRRPAGRP